MREEKKSMRHANQEFAEQFNADIRQVNFARTDICSESNPISCHIRGNAIPIIGNWSDLLASITECCIKNYGDKIENLKSKWFSYHSNNPYLLVSKPLLNSKKLSNGYWIAVNYSIPRLLRVTAGLCRYCGINLNNIEILYA
jgi:hypothetical protein